jgi:NRAMP (natural resistance-associated macrophage protein)-like metal ion transporter
MKTPDQQAPTTSLQDRAQSRKRERSRPRFRRMSPIFRLLAILGPGIIAANAGNDAGGVATYSSAGASYGYNLLWALAITAIFVGIVQEMCARMGAVTGKGLSDLIREQFGVRWTVLAMLALLIANTGITISEFIGVAASVQVLANDPHTPLIYLIVPLSGLILWWLVTRGTYRRVEIVFLIISLGFLAYIPAAFAAHPSWPEVAKGFIAPRLNMDANYWPTTAALVGTTLSPYMLFYIQSAVADKGIRMEEYVYEKVDVYSSTIFSNIISAFMIIATGATLFVAHQVVNTAADAAFALRAFAGQYASLLFGLGLFGASLLAGAVLPLTTAYGISEAFGFERGVSRSFREAPVFQSLFTGMIVLGVIVSLIPGLPFIQVLIILQDVNAAMMPILLVFVILLINNRRLMGRRVNKTASNILAWLTTISVTFLVILWLLNAIFGVAL